MYKLTDILSSNFQPHASSSRHTDFFNSLPHFVSAAAVGNSDAHDDNVHFLRSNNDHSSSPDSSSLIRHHRRMSTAAQQRPGNEQNRGFNFGSIESNNRIHWVNHQQAELSRVPNYEGNSTDVRSIYGWAPGGDDTAIDPLPEWIASDSEATRDISGRREHSWGSSGGDNNLTVSRFETNQSEDPMARRRDLLQNAMELLHRDLEWWDQERPSASTSRAYRYLTASTQERRNLTHNDLRSRILAHRMCLGSQASQVPSNLPRLEETIKYLGRLRYSGTHEESVRSAAASGFVRLEQFCPNMEDFVLDTASIAPYTESSWLRSGMVFSGLQRAARQVPSASSRSEPVVVDGNSESSSRIQVQTTGGRRYVPENLCRAGLNNKDEKWPVKVTIHSVNQDDMTISGIMEAYNLPDKTSPAIGLSHAHVVTFLEGEIIDFNKFTLETDNFSADADTDSVYWRQLQPFKHLTDTEVVKNLVNRKWITEELSKRWLLMRWKGRSLPAGSSSFYSLRLMLHRAVLCHSASECSTVPFSHDYRVLLHLPLSG